MELSKTQKRVIKFMREDWLLSQWMGFEGTYRLSKWAERPIKIHGNTVNSLYDKKIIRMQSEEYPHRIFKLTPKGISIKI